MKQTDAFNKEKNECKEPFTHITEGTAEPALSRIDELFGAADVLSIQNAEKHRRIILALSAAGTLLALAFLLYDEVDWHGLIIACGVMILCLFLIRRIAGSLDCHRKYLEYRVLAESLRLQYFLSLAGIRKHVSELLPLTIKMGAPWIYEMLAAIPAPELSEKRSVLDCWIRDQKEYHEKALLRTRARNDRDGRIAKTVVIVTICTYAAALIFEFMFYRSALAAGNAAVIRTGLKILLGMMSAVTLFTGNYYGKMSLPNVIDDHKRMIALYDKAEQEITEKGEDPELLLGLAREYLNENSTWYAYQNKNKPDLVF